MVINISVSQKEDELLCTLWRRIFPTENDPDFLVVLICVFNFLLLVATIFGNALIIAAVWRTPSLRSPSIIFLCGLASTDLTVGALAQPMFLFINIKILTEPTAYSCALQNLFFVVSSTTCAVSLFTATAISVDRLIALKYHMRYPSVVTVNRALSTIAINWMVGGFTATMIFWEELALVFGIMVVTIAVPLGFSAYAHFTIFCIARRHKKQIKAQELAFQSRSGISLRRFKLINRTSTNALLVYLCLLICYAPFFVVWLLEYCKEKISLAPREVKWLAVAWKLTMTSIFINSTLNPIIYCWRLKETRTAVHKTFLCQ